MYHKRFFSVFPFYNRTSHLHHRLPPLPPLNLQIERDELRLCHWHIGIKCREKGNNGFVEEEKKTIKETKQKGDEKGTEKKQTRSKE